MLNLFEYLTRCPVNQCFRTAEIFYESTNNRVRKKSATGEKPIYWLSPLDISICAAMSRKSRLVVLTLQSGYPVTVLRIQPCVKRKKYSPRESKIMRRKSFLLVIYEKRTINLTIFHRRWACLLSKIVIVMPFSFPDSPLHILRTFI